MKLNINNLKERNIAPSEQTFKIKRTKIIRCGRTHVTGRLYLAIHFLTPNLLKQNRTNSEIRKCRNQPIVNHFFLLTAIHVNDPHCINCSNVL